MKSKDHQTFNFHHSIVQENLNYLGRVLDLLISSQIFNSSSIRDSIFPFQKPADTKMFNFKPKLDIQLQTDIGLFLFTLIKPTRDYHTHVSLMRFFQETLMVLLIININTCWNLDSLCLVQPIFDLISLLKCCKTCLQFIHQYQLIIELAIICDGIFFTGKILLFQQPRHKRNSMDPCEG